MKVFVMSLCKPVYQLRLLTLLFILAAVSLQAQTPLIEQLRNELNFHPQEDTFRVNRLGKLGFELRNKMPKEARAFYEEALLLSRKLKYEYGEANALLGLSFYHRFNGDYPEAVGFGKESLEKFTRLKDTANMIASIYIIAYVTSFQGESALSVSYSFDALRLADRIKSSKWLILVNTQLGNTFLRLDETVKAKHHLSIAMELAESVHDDDGMEHCLLPLEQIAEREKRFGDAMGYYKKGLAMALSKKSVTNQLIYTLGMEEVNLALKNYDEVFRSIGPIIQLIKQGNFTGYYSWVDHILANAYFETGKLDSAIFYGEKCLKGTENRGEKNLTKTINKLLAAAYAGKGNYKEAFSREQTYLNYKDSLNETETVRRIAASQYTYELEKKQAEINLLAQNEKLVKERNSEQRKLLWGSWIGLVIIAAMLSFIWRNNLQKRKANKALETTLANLKSAQSQLIQSEKMASLGELTAGIAHEIQNPLNFVNNFAELNKELLTEMSGAINQGNFEEVKSIVKDLTDNEEKINQHGKRADAIVKGMLQHSRTSSATKEPTDINKLADEYLRLAYHGLRAKDKTFNATLITNFDQTAGNISIIPQDIGRVLLNVINNAFYSVNEKKKQAGENYEPTVSLSTKKINNKIEIIIADNGNGVPQKIIDKIFQPFFTTKPTGQGTGLGLSLAYDIVKAHGGELSVKTQEGRGSTFSIQLPA